MPPQNLRSAVEALLFSSDQPLTLVQLAEAVEAEAAAVTEALTALGEEYRSRDAGIEVREMAGGWIVTTTSAMNPFVTRMLRGKRKMRLSRAALETLAIIAYKQPVTKTEAEAIRGVDCSGTLATLLERSLVTIKGRSTVVGRPLLYGTTDEFLNYFGLRDITELPRPEELRALVAAREPEQMEMIEVDADGMPLALAEAAAAATVKEASQEAAEEREADAAGVALLAAGVAAGVVAAGGIDAAELDELEAALDEASDPDFDDEALAAELAELDAADEDDLDADEADEEDDDADEAEFADDDDDEAYEDDEDEYEEEDDDESDDSEDAETTELVEEDELDEYEQGMLVAGDGSEYSDDEDADEDEDEYDDDDEYDEDDDDFAGDDADEDDDRAAHLSETDGR